jgi:peptide/nickel transport system substrate-binding protein
MKRLVLTLAVFFPLVLVAQEKAEKDDSLALAGQVKVDEFNDQVKDKTKGDGTPVRGGMVRVRLPADPKSLNYAIDLDATTQQICLNYLYDGLAQKDYETFEWLPYMARYWRTRDVVFLKKDNQRLEGRVVSEDDKGNIFFAEGASKWTIARHELEAFQPTDTKVTWKKGFGEGSIEGKLSFWPGGRYTVYVEEKPAKTVEIKADEIAAVDEPLNGKPNMVPGIRRESVYDFVLRKGITWHDGEPFTADDVTFSYDACMNPDVHAQQLQGNYLDNMPEKTSDAVFKVSDDTIRFVLRRQYYAALSLCAGVPVFPKHRYQVDKYKGDPKGFAAYFNDHPDNSKPVGCGRYKFSNWERGKYLEIVRNDEWWGGKSGLPWFKPGQPFLDKIQFIIINNAAAALRALTSGEVDADFDIEQLQWIQPETNKADFTSKFARARYLEPAYVYMGWNEKRPDVDEKHRFFADPKVRLAMTMLIDREKILKEIHFGLGQMVTGPFFPKGPFYDHSLKPIEYNPEKAKALLDAAGWIDHSNSGIRDKDGVKLEFDYQIHNAREYHRKVAEIVKEELEKAGIRVNIKQTEFPSFIAIIDSRKYDACRFASSDPDPIDSDPYQLWHSSQFDGNGGNVVGYDNKDVDDLCVKARRELDFKKRQRMFKKLHRILHEEQPVTFLFNLDALYFYDKKFRNVKLYVMGNSPYDLDEWYIPKELQGAK